MYVFFMIYLINSKNSIMVSKEFISSDLKKQMKENFQKTSLKPYDSLNDKQLKQQSEALKLKDEKAEIMPEDIEPMTKKEMKEMRNDEFESMENYINNKLKLNKGSLPSLNSRSFFKNLHNWILQHLNDLVIDGRLGITLEMRYFLCCFIVLYIPPQYGFFFPKFLISLLDNKKLKNKNETLKKIIEEIKTFFDYIESTKKDKFLVSFTISRSFRIGIDEKTLLWIKELPDRFFNDLKSLLSNIMLDWNFKAEGYNEWKHKKKK